RCFRDRPRNARRLQTGGAASRSVGPPLNDAERLGWGGEQPDGRTGLIVANRLGWIRRPVGRSDGGGHRLRESGRPCRVPAARFAGRGAVLRQNPQISILERRDRSIRRQTEDLSL